MKQKKEKRCPRCKEKGIKIPGTMKKSGAILMCSKCGYGEM